METQKPFSTQMVELVNALLDKIEPALKSGRITPQERESIATLLTRVQTLESREIPTAYDDAPLTARIAALEAKPEPTPYDDTELRGKVAALELREDKVGVTAEEMGRAISAAIAALPPDQVGISEERVQELLAAIHTYDDSALSGRVQALEERPAPTPYNDSELRGKVVALETLPSGLEALKQRVQQLETSAGASGGASAEYTADLTRRIEQLEQLSSQQISDLSHRLEEAERKNQDLANTALEFQQVKAFLRSFALSMRDMSGARPEDVGYKIGSYIEGAVSEASQYSAGAALIFN